MNESYNKKLDMGYQLILKKSGIPHIIFNENLDVISEFNIREHLHLLSKEDAEYFIKLFADEINKSISEIETKVDNCDIQVNFKNQSLSFFIIKSDFLKNENVYFLIFKNIYDRIKSEKKRIADITRAINHDIRTPLNIVLGYSELIQNIDSINSIHKKATSIVQQVDVIQEKLTLLTDYLKFGMNEFDTELDVMSFYDLLKTDTVIEI